MATEIERKFLVLNTQFKNESYAQIQIKQGFLNTHKKRTVRIRITDKKGYITIKGKSNKSGTSRFEWEKEIPLQDATSLLQLCEKGVIEKTRYLIKVNKHTFEVDEFFGIHNGLIVAEVELTSENETFTKPKWIGKEVTGDKRYYNAVLSKGKIID